MWKFIQDNKIKEVREEDTFNRAFYAGEFEEDTEHTISDYVQFNGEYVLKTSNEAIEQKKADVRSIRNQYLADTDKFMIADFPISEEEKANYKSYRQYLRDYTEQESWWETNPKTFEEWKSEE